MSIHSLVSISIPNITSVLKFTLFCLNYRRSHDFLCFLRGLYTRAGLNRETIRHLFLFTRRFFDNSYYVFLLVHLVPLVILIRELASNLFLFGLLTLLLSTHLLLSCSCSNLVLETLPRGQCPLRMPSPRVKLICA